MVIGNPFPLKQNSGKSFQGSIVLGKGFVLSPEEAEALIAKNPRNKDVLFPYLNGDDLNNDPEQKPSRWVINFFDWDEEKAQSYPDCYEIIERSVKPERQRWELDKNGNEIVGTYALRKPLPQKWWIYGEKRPALYNTISQLDQVMGIALTSKSVSIATIPANFVFSHSLGIFAFSDEASFSILQSCLHEQWAWKYSSTLESRIRYTPSICYETFPFIEFKDAQLKRLSEIGKKYNSFRKDLLKMFNIGLTECYNLYNADVAANGKESIWLKKHLEKFSLVPHDVAVKQIEEYRNLQIQLDETVLDVYGWSDILLNHGFYEVDHLPENDRIRFTIHQNARKELLSRLLKLNHTLYASENNEEKVQVKKNKKKTDSTSPTLF